MRRDFSRNALVATPLLLLALATVTVTALASGQTQPARQPDPSPQRAGPVLRTTTRLVQLNVIVEDSKGRPVLDLKREDFSLLDEGLPQDIAIFSPAELSPNHSAAARSTSNVFDNRHPQDGKNHSVSVILLDAMNTPFEDQAYIKAEVIKLLRQREPKEYLAIYFLGNELYVLQDFTQDSKALLASLDRLKPHALALYDASTPAPSGFVLRTGDPSLAQLDERVNHANAEVAAASVDTRVRTTSDGFTAIADHLAFISGRKSLIWVSGSFPLYVGYGGSTLTPASIDVQSYTPELERAARALNRVNMSVYPVDATGLALYDGSFPGMAPVASLGSDFFTVTQKHDSMNLLAEHTGGRAFYGVNDVAGSLRMAIEEGESSYLLGFYPNHNHWDGSFHRLKLRLKPRGLQVRCRKGYFATPDSTDQHGEMQTDLAEAVKNPVDSTSLDLRVTVNAAESSSSRALKLYLRLDPRELLLDERNDGLRDGVLDLLFCQLGAGDQPITADHKRVELHLTPTEYAPLLKSGIYFGDRLELAPNARVLRVFVRDSSGALASVTIPVNSLPPPPAKPQASPTGSP